jgi:hypothetical protein
VHGVTVDVASSVLLMGWFAMSTTAGAVAVQCTLVACDWLGHYRVVRPNQTPLASLLCHPPRHPPRHLRLIHRMFNVIHCVVHVIHRVVHPG